MLPSTKPKKFKVQYKCHNCQKGQEGTSQINKFVTCCNEICQSNVCRDCFKGKYKQGQDKFLKIQAAQANTW